MNTTSVEITLNSPDKNKFLEWMKTHKGPYFYEEESQKYFFEDEVYAEYYNEKYDDEICLFTMVPVYREYAVQNIICKAAKDLNIHLKYILMYQDPGTGEASGSWTIL